MALPQLRRKENNVLLCNYFAVEKQRERWKGRRAIHTTISGNTIPGDGGVLEYWYDFGLVFASDDAVNTLANYDTLMYDINKNNHFTYVDRWGQSWFCFCVSEWVDDEQTPDIEEVEITVTGTFKVEGYLI